MREGGPGGRGGGRAKVLLSVELTLKMDPLGTSL